MNYDAMLAFAKQNPDAADFKALRIAFSESSYYNPYSALPAAQQTLNMALRAGDWQAALPAANAVLDAFHLNIDAHTMAAFLHNKLAQPDQEAYHLKFAGGLLQSILSSGDGRSFETAFVVIGVSEEYSVVRALGGQTQGQALVQHDGHAFDILNVVFPRQGVTTSTEVYFNIDIPKGWLGRSHHS